MTPAQRIIIDTDPGVDDILAILLALAAKPEEVEVVLLSLTHGNIDVQNCLRNLVSMFHIIEQELEWRKARGQEEGFESLKAFKPIIAVGAEQPLADQQMMADYFHGTDGLGDIHATHPHFTPEESWKMLFQSPPPYNETNPKDLAAAFRRFIPSTIPAHKEILRVLKENEMDTITIVAVGPLTNLALAAAEDPETFLRVKEVIVMGGTINLEGNITPVAEFNVYADAVASARVYALTSPTPSSTTPPIAPPSSLTAKPEKFALGPYPQKLSRQLRLIQFPLDVTTNHLLKQSEFFAKVKPLAEAGSPLAGWVRAFVSYTFTKMESLNLDLFDLSLHDPLCIWYVLTATSPEWTHSPKSPEDIRVECSGQWTRGMCVVDRRGRVKATGGDEVEGDPGSWLNGMMGNRVFRMVGTPGEDAFGPYLLKKIFG